MCRYDLSVVSRSLHELGDVSPRAVLVMAGHVQSIRSASLVLNADVAVSHGFCKYKCDVTGCRTCGALGIRNR